MRGYGAALVATLMAATPAQAAWMRASTKHFIIYAEESPAAINRRASDLELVDTFLRTITGIDGGTDDANKLTIYVTSDIAALRRLYGNGSANIAGFYNTRVSGPIAFTPRRAGTGADDFNAQIVLFHEYAHHFMFGNSTAAYPAWFGEGYAEVVSTMRIDDRKISFGNAANHRGWQLFAPGGLSLAQMFEPPVRKLSEAETGSLYARGWLLSHYLLLNKERRGQLQEYVVALNNGKPGLEAARGAFGDLRKLDADLNRYLRASTLPGLIVDRSRFATPTVEVDPLTPGQSAMIELRMASDRGVNAKTAPPLFAKGAKIAAAYPDDPVVQGWLAEMAFDAKDMAAADAAADRAMAADARSSQALLYKARVKLAQAMQQKAPAAAFKDARTYILRANKLSNDNADALHLYYESFGMAGQPASDNAKAALMKAQELVPQDDGLRMQVVGQLIVDNDIPAARRMLLPLAFSPHARADSPPRTLLAAIDAKASRDALLGMAPKGEDAAGEGN